MTEIYFVRTRHVYDSYRDMLRLIELSDFPMIYVDEVDTAKEGVYIFTVMNGEVRPHVDNQHAKPRRAHLILWNLERPSGSAGTVYQYAKSCWNLLNGIWEDTGERAKTRFLDEIWVSDAKLAEETQMRFVPLGSDEGLGEPGEEKKYAFCHMSYEVGRRTHIYKHWGVDQIGPNGWGEARDKILKESKFALNIHQDTFNFQEPLRFALFAAYGLPIISEDLFNQYPWTSETMITGGYYEIVGKLKQALSEDYIPYRDMGLRARERMTGEFRFKKMVELAVKESVDRWR